MKIRNTCFFMQRLQKTFSVFVKVFVLLVATFFIKLPSQTYAQAKVEVTFSKNQTEQIFALIERYIDNNPEIVIRALEKIQNKEKEELATEQKRQIDQNKKLLFSNPTGMILGNPEGTISIVEFFDYQCGYCKKMLRVLIKATKDNPNLRVILKEYPILGPVSFIAAQASLASLKQDKYKDFHKSLMLMNGRISERAIFKVAKEVGLNIDKLKADMTDPEIFSIINSTRELGQKLAIRGTPALVVNNEIIPGAISLNRLRNLLADEN
tara:strand:+ start:430 stop:1230 length:801 start_codon:yes stop_codon:yes gene_type:complete